MIRDEFIVNKKDSYENGNGGHNDDKIGQKVENHLEKQQNRRSFVRYVADIAQRLPEPHDARQGQNCDKNCKKQLSKDVTRQVIHGS